jgi:hypothetical protein
MLLAKKITIGPVTSVLAWSPYLHASGSEIPSEHEASHTPIRETLLDLEPNSRKTLGKIQQRYHDSQASQGSRRTKSDPSFEIDVQLHQESAR